MMFAMSKDYNQWVSIKRNIHNERPRVFFEEREIWFSYLGENVGFEQDGRGEEYLRPLLVIKKFNKEICWTIPLTTSHKIGKYYFLFY